MYFVIAFAEFDPVTAHMKQPDAGAFVHASWTCSTCQSPPLRPLPCVTLGILTNVCYLHFSFGGEGSHLRSKGSKYGRKRLIAMESSALRRGQGTWETVPSGAIDQKRSAKCLSHLTRHIYRGCLVRTAEAAVGQRTFHRGCKPMHSHGTVSCTFVLRFFFACRRCCSG